LQLDKGLQSEFYLQSELDLEFSSALQSYVILTQTWSEQSCHFQQLLHAALAPATSFLGSIASFHRMNEEIDPGLFHAKHLQLFSPLVPISYEYTKTSISVTSILLVLIFFVLFFFFLYLEQGPGNAVNGVMTINKQNPLKHIRSNHE
jgi:hypothetical protein